MLGAVAGALPTIQAEEPSPAEGPSPERREEFRQHFKEHGERMAKELGLSDDQKNQMKAIGAEQRTSAEAVRADASLSPEQKREKMHQLMQDSKTKRQAVLTPEQRKKAEGMKEKFKEHRRQHEHGDQPPAAQ